MAIDINIPSQVKTFANLAAFPVTGSLKTIFIAEDTNKTYRWTGSVYVEISASQAAAWGTITGTLSSQTDLNTALSGKVPTTRTLTINGTTQNLSADRTFTISTGITIGTTAITSGTVGRVLFEGTGNVVSESANLFWDNTNGRLGIGTSSPTARIHIQGSSILSTNSSLAVFNSALTELFRIRDNGNIGINTTTDAGYKLDVNGTARVKGSGSTAATTSLLVQNSAGTAALTIKDDLSTSFANGLLFNRDGATTRIFNGGTIQYQSNAGSIQHSFLNQIGPGLTGTNVIMGADAQQLNNVKLLDVVNQTGSVLTVLAKTAGGIVGINNSSPNSSAQLDVTSTTQGFLPPRMTTTQINAIASPADGLQAYNTTISHMCVYQAGSWVKINHSPM